MGQCYWLNSRLDWSDWTHWSTDWKDWPVELDWSVAWLVDWSKWLVEYMINRMVSWLNYLWSTRVPEWDTSLVHLLACFVQSQRVVWSIRQSVKKRGVGEPSKTCWLRARTPAYNIVYSIRSTCIPIHICLYIYTNMLPLYIYIYTLII